MNNLLGNLNYLKHRSRITQEKLAEIVGVKRNLVDAWLSGRSQPQTEELKKISDAFKVSIDYLVRQDISKFSDKVINENYRRIQFWLNYKER